ncbi:hypothetical protein COO60DRAFT_1547236 [Scenedesmus sp. NREL 46B-D3]|nr:hypothetical protein COO60DRAFT_1547236 [Scenedesmus sp. NREL 46B-D3]
MCCRPLGSTGSMLVLWLVSDLVPMICVYALVGGTVRHWCGLIGHANALDVTWVKLRTSFTWFFSILYTRQFASVLLAFLNRLEVRHKRGVV